MSPLSSLIDHSQLINRVQTLYSFAPAEETVAADAHVAADNERSKQMRALVTAALLFVPFLAGYVALVHTH
ncbi:hypothetical protein [Paraburkholderia sp. J76]|uniref:hypothetical protein n=1 Tax=Paraburkholderia sp. J76 TaxID=2805439 RepID=UPI002ABD5F2F|nr:hypothetical protein [Paraburkholderia sp. J76]